MKLPEAVNNVLLIVTALLVKAALPGPVPPVLLPNQEIPSYTKSKTKLLLPAVNGVV